MKNAKTIGTLLADHFKLNKQIWPSTEKEKEVMAHVPYSSTMESLIYAMVCTRPDIILVVGVVSRFLSNPGKNIGKL